MARIDEDGRIGGESITGRYQLDGYEILFADSDDLFVWSSVGQPEGEYALVLQSDGGPDFDRVVTANNKLFFTAEVQDPTELVVIDEGGARVITPRTEENNPEVVGSIGSAVLFTGRADGGVRSLFVTDGNTTQQASFTDAPPGSGASLGVSLSSLAGEQFLDIKGTEFDDTLDLNVLGTSVLQSKVDLGQGDDVITGRNDGAYLVGGGGSERISSTLAGVYDHLGQYSIGGNDIVFVNGTVNLRSTGAQVVQGGTLTLSGIYNLSGSGDFAGNAGVNIFDGQTGNDRFRGFEGNDTLYGGGGNDILDGGTGLDLLVGGTGNDIMFVDDAGDVVRELAGEGNDTVKTTLASYTLGANVEVLQYVGSSNATGTGNALANTLFGANGDDTLYGLANDDRLVGGFGRDALYGGSGRDQLTGGAGADRFVFEAGDFATIAKPDVITDFSHSDSDYIQLTGVASSFIGAAAFTGVAGQVRYASATDGINVLIDTNGDRIADGAIFLSGLSSIAASDFLL